MKTLIVEDDFTSHVLLQKLLTKYGPIDVVENGMDAVKCVKMEMDKEEPYDLICLDIMMPEMDGYDVLKKIRSMEKEKGIDPSNGAKIVMTTILNDPENVTEAFKNLCNAYLVKPIELTKLLEELQNLDLIQ